MLTLLQIILSKFPLNQIFLGFSKSAFDTRQKGRVYRKKSKKNTQKRRTGSGRLDFERFEKDYN